MPQQTYNVSENVRIDVRNCHNRVTVIGWDDAQHAAVDYASKQEGDTIIVEDADRVTLRVPRRAEINIANCEADVRVEDLEGRVELSHIGGDVSLRNLSAEVLATNLDGDLAARNVVSLRGEGSWDSDVALHNVKSLETEQVEGSLTMNDVETATVNKIEGDLVAKGVRSLKGDGEWEGDVVLRKVESAEVNEVKGDVTLSELGNVHFRSIHGDLNAFNVRGALAIEQVNGDANLREVSGNVSLDRVEGDLIASGVRNSIRVQAEGDAVVSFVEIAQAEFRAEGDVVINLPNDVNAEIELDAPHGQLVAHADINVTEEDESHVHGTLGSGGTKIRAESGHGDLILRAGGAQRHHIHAAFRSDEFADMGQRIAEEVRESMHGLRVHAGPKIKFKPKIKIKKHWGWRHLHHEEDREEAEKPRIPAAGSPERRAILDAIARGEISVDDAITKLRGAG